MKQWIVLGVTALALMGGCAPQSKSRCARTRCETEYFSFVSDRDRDGSEILRKVPVYMNQTTQTVPAAYKKTRTSNCRKAEVADCRIVSSPFIVDDPREIVLAERCAPVGCGAPICQRAVDPRREWIVVNPETEASPVYGGTEVVYMEEEPAVRASSVGGVPLRGDTIQAEKPSIIIAEKTPAPATRKESGETAAKPAVTPLAGLPKDATDPLPDLNSPAEIFPAGADKLTYIQSAASGVYLNGVLTLHTVEEKTGFRGGAKEQPRGTVSTKAFIRDWNAGHSPYRKRAPQALVSIRLSGGELIARVELTQPVLTATSLSYNARVLEGSIPEAFDEVHLYIEPMK